MIRGQIFKRGNSITKIPDVRYLVYQDKRFDIVNFKLLTDVILFSQFLTAFRLRIS